MATKFGVNATKRLSDVPSAKIAVSDQGGRKRVAYDSYTISAILAAGDILKMGKIPAGARILGWKIAVHTVSGAGSVKVGWSAGVTGAEAADDDGLDVSVDLTAQAISLEAASVPGYTKKFTEDVDIIVTGLVDSSAAGLISVAVEYSLD